MVWEGAKDIQKHLNLLGVHLDQAGDQLSKLLLRDLQQQGHYYILRYAIAKSAIGPAPQAVTNSEVEQNTGWSSAMYDNICLDMRSNETKIRSVCDWLRWWCMAAQILSCAEQG